jgi:hypothetical protein
VDDEDIEADALAVSEEQFSLPARPMLGDFIATCLCQRPMADVPCWTDVDNKNTEVKALAGVKLGVRCPQG